MKQIVAHKIELIPEKEQAIYFAKACGTARFTYNWALNRWIEIHKAGGKTSHNDLKKEFTAIKKIDFPWVEEVTKCSPEAAFANLGSAFANFFRDSKKSKKTGYPKFKCKGKSKDTFYISNQHFSVHGDHVRIPKLGLVKMTEKLRFDGKIMSANISRKADRWFITISVEVENLDKNRPVKKSSVGIDLGIKTALSLSSGKEYLSPKALKKSEKKLAKAQRVLSRRVKGSKNRDKAKLKVARIHAKIANQRNDFNHKTTTAIANRYQYVFVENLNVKGMMANHKLAKSIADISFSEIVRQLEYKTTQREGHCEKINRFFPSSKQCIKCKQKHTNLKLSDRIFVCQNPLCGHTEDRDLHASKNIHKEGLRVFKFYQKNTGGQPGINDHGQNVTSATPRKRFGKSAGKSGKAMGNLAKVKSKETVALSESQIDSLFNTSF